MRQVLGQGRSADPYDVAFPISHDAKESELVAVAAMAASGGIKLTLEEAHNISAVFHVPPPRPWLLPAQTAHLAALSDIAGCTKQRIVSSNCIDDRSCSRAVRLQAAAAMSAVVLPALLGGRALEVPPRSPGNVPRLVHSFAFAVRKTVCYLSHICI